LLGISVRSRSNLPDFNMSKTYSIVCTQCKESLWIGQSSLGQGYLYTNKEDAEKHWGFLKNHEGHPLVFVNEESGILDECEEIE
jgi:hypothetical protein